MKRRILSLLLALCLFAGLIPAGSAVPSELELNVDMEQLTAHARSMYQTLEGYYWSVTRDDRGAVSIGFMQWHGENAHKLLKKICAAAPNESKQKLGTALYNEVVNTPVYAYNAETGKWQSSWQYRILTKEEGEKVSALINTQIGRQCQDETANEFIRGEAERGWQRGIRTEAALLYYCSIENQYGSGGARDVLGDARAAVGLSDEDSINSLNEFHNAVVQAAVNWKYIRDHLTYRKNVYKYLTETLELDPGPELVLPRLTELPADGAQVVIYCQAAAGVLGRLDGGVRKPALRAAASLTEDGTLPYENLADGALIFTVHVTGSGDSAFYSFENDGKYLALPANTTDADGKPANSGKLQLIAKPSDSTALRYTQWSAAAISGGWVLVNRAACQGSAQCCVELYKKAFRGGRYTVSAKERYALNFFPVKDRTCSGYVHSPTGEAALGADLSWFNGVIDWSLLAPELDFAILRAAYTGNGTNFEGTQPAKAKDKYYDDNAAGCAAHGVPFGVYYYGGARTAEQARTEAEYLLECLGTENLPTLPIFYDVYETNNILSPEMDNEAILEVVTAFCTVIEEAGYRAGVYATTNVWNNKLTDPAYGNWVRWTAQRGSSSMTVNAGVNVWQFTNEGRLPGVETAVQLDCWLGTLGDDAHPCEARICPAGCEEDGMLSCSCTLHANEETSYLRLPAPGHLWSAETRTEAPTCTEQGYSYHPCLRCGERDKFDFVPAPGHVWASKSEVHAPTCTAEGYTLRTCTVCNTTERTAEKAALGHKWDKGVVVSQPTETSEGLKRYTCARCGGIKEEKLAKLPYFRFADVKDPKASYYDAVYWAYRHRPYQITAGIDKTHFGPNLTVTRAQAMVFLWAAKDKPKPKTAESNFADVRKTDWYYKAVLWAVENKITVGTDAAHFSPNKTCNRAEIITFLYAAMKKPKVSIADPYKDVKGKWYEKAALWAWAKGIERGANKKFSGGTPCTRGAIVTYLYRALEKQS